MTANPNLVIVSERFCDACGTQLVNIHHQNFPEMWIGGETPKLAAEELANHLESNLDAVSDPFHREPVRNAIADVQAFLASDAVLQPDRSDVIDTLAANPTERGAPPIVLAKTEILEVRRLTLAKGREIPTHQTRGEITVHCLEGRIAFAAEGTTRELGAGQLIVLGAGVPHSLFGLEDSSVLVTKVRFDLPSSP